LSVVTQISTQRGSLSAIPSFFPKKSLPDNSETSSVRPVGIYPSNFLPHFTGKNHPFTDKNLPYS
ncbi:hypothetical protein, partial [Mucilaginibacter gossypii]